MDVFHKQSMLFVRWPSQRAEKMFRYTTGIHATLRELMRYKNLKRRKLRLVKANACAHVKSRKSQREKNIHRVPLPPCFPEKQSHYTSSSAKCQYRTNGPTRLPSFTPVRAHNPLHLPQVLAFVLQEAAEDFARRPGLALVHGGAG